MPDIPDFTMKPNFPISSVIDAASRNAQLQLQAQQAGQQSLIQGLKSIGDVGQSIYERKLQMAQALAQAKMYAQTPAGQQALGTNQVASGPQGPVTQNQTAAYDPNSGTVTPNQSPLNMSDLTTSFLGMSPKDFMENQIQQKAAQTAQGQLALQQQVEPQKVAIEGKKAVSEIENTAIMRQIQGMLGAATIKNQQQERAQAAQNSEFEANKEAAKHWFLHPVDAYRASQNITSAGNSSNQGGALALPQVGQTIAHPSGVKITRIK